MRRAGFVLCLIVMFAMPLVGNAKLWNYSVIGSVTYEGSSIPTVVTGYIVIDDQLRGWFDGTPASPQPGGAYGFLIRQFSLHVGGLTFFGSSATLVQSGQPFSYMYMDMDFSGQLGMFEWGIQGTGTLFPDSLGYWVGYYLFYNSDGTSCGSNNYSQLAPIITVHTFNADSVGTLWLTRTGAAKTLGKGNKP